MPKPTSKLFDASLWLLSAFAGLALLVYAYLGTFSRHMADDYCSVDFLRRNFFSALWDNYLNVSDRFSNFMLIALSEALHPRLVSVLPALALALWVVGIAWLLYEASRFSGQAWDKPLIAALTFSLVFLALLQAPNRFQILYWRSSMATHFAPLVCMSFLAAALLRSILAAEKKPVALWAYPLFFLSAFLIGGFSEPTALVMISLLALAIFSAWFWMKRPTRRAALILLGTAFAGAALALAAMAFSPANSFRLDNAAPPTLPVLLSRAFGYGVEFMFGWFKTLPLPAFFTILIPLLIFYQRYAAPAAPLTLAQRKRVYALLAVLPILTYLLIVASFLPSVYGQSFPVERARFSGQLILVVGAMIESALFASLLAQLRPRWLAAANPKLAVSLLLAFAALYPLRAAWISLADVPVYRQRAAWWDEREAMIYLAIEQGQTNLIVQQFDGVDGVKEMDVSENHWVNRCVAKYYQINSIRAYSDVMFP